MKKINIIAVVLVLFTAVGFTSCSDLEPIDPAIDLTPDPVPNPEGGLFKVDFDGQTYTAAATTVYISGGSIVINALRANGDSFGIIVDGNTIGTYPANDNLLAYNPAGSEFAYVGNHPTDDTANTGTFTITSINSAEQTISGTFNFTGYWSDFTNTTVPPKQFTNGIFTNIPYTTDNPTGDSFSANINGAAFNDVDIFTATSGSGTSEFINISASDVADNAISIAVRSNLGVGSYDITGDFLNDVVRVSYNAASVGIGLPAMSGSVNITEKTTVRIKGTFNATVMTGSTTYQLTQGNFDVAY